MPVIIPNKNSSPVFFPQSNYKIARYLDLTKFVSLLQRRALFFTRLDKFEDPFEGTTAKNNYKTRYNFYATRYFKSSKFKKLSEDEIIKKVQSEYDADEKFKKLVCVSCWNKSDAESVALWKIYSDLQKGIMITTTRDKIIDAFKLTKEIINISEVKYIDFNRDRMPDGNKMYPVIHKQKAYKYEEEIRLIHVVKFESGLFYDWTKEEVQAGKYINTNLMELIDEIIISPYAPKWFFDIVKSLLDKYDYNFPIKKSELSK